MLNLVFLFDLHPVKLA
jgi:hypothetical protein